MLIIMPSILVVLQVPLEVVKSLTIVMLECADDVFRENRSVLVLVSVIEKKSKY